MNPMTPMTPKKKKIPPPKEKLSAIIAPKKTEGPAPTPQTPRGMKDLLPTEEKFWRQANDSAISIARAYGYEWIETPIIEETQLFVRGVGKQTDIVEKEMFSFVDQGGEALSLRPEATAAVSRAYTSHGMVNLPQPVKLWYSGPMFRHERPQAGRLRQFHQFGFEILGEGKPIADAELVLMAVRYFGDLGVPVTVELNSIGDHFCREPYKEKLIAYYRGVRSKLCENCKTRLSRSPMRLLDCKEPECVTLRPGAPQIVDHLCEDCRNHFMKVVDYLDEADAPYSLNPHLVRGLDYYTRTVFEVLPKSEEETARAHSALSSCGRYDGLVELLGGRPKPAAGFSIGLERVINRIKELGLPVAGAWQPAVYFAQLGEPAKRKALVLFEILRKAGIPVTVSFTKDALKQQMEIANRLGVRYTVILGQKEILDGTVILRDMEAGIQEIVDEKKLAADLRKKLGLDTQKLSLPTPVVSAAPPPKPFEEEDPEEAKVTEEVPEVPNVKPEEGV